MAESKQGVSPFVSMFIPGLVVGLAVGGLAGAFITPILTESNAYPAPTGGGKPAVESRDARTPEKPAEIKPVEVKPASPPAPAPSPGTPPATPPTDPKPTTPK